MGGQREDKSKLTAENMLKAGLDQTVQWTSSTECTVPSQTAFGTIYNVDIVNVVCNCPAATTRAKMVVPSPDIESTSIDETRQQLKEDKETTDQAIKRKIEEINIYVNNKNFQTIDVKKRLFYKHSQRHYIFVRQPTFPKQQESESNNRCFQAENPKVQKLIMTIQ
ncbi:unnamed protein product [Mytilus edulis]|uniref:Uncharacterized protein n=1 Tax=Mytilus edulis TaxID=6550 RepID=A0A8S3S2R0_MYTED|nr:unnamed protein product [Mytilus edulis]